MICGLGIDCVEIRRIENILNKWGDKFTGRIYSENERFYCERKAHSSQHYAVRFAAKEAFLKCLGVGIGDGIAFNHIEVILDTQGKPMLRLHREARKALKRINILNVHVSLTHTRNYASAVVILER